MANVSMLPLPGAATMAHPAVINACRVGYRAAHFAGNTLCAWSIKRAWMRADAELILAYLDGVILELANTVGAWDLWVESKAARAALASEVLS